MLSKNDSNIFYNFYNAIVFYNFVVKHFLVPVQYLQNCKLKVKLNKDNILCLVPNGINEYNQKRSYSIFSSSYSILTHIKN